jgi:hypothetical protein
VISNEIRKKDNNGGKGQVDSDLGDVVDNDG